MKIFKSILSLCIVLTFSLFFLGKVDAEPVYTFRVMPQLNSIVIEDVPDQCDALEVVINKEGTEYSYNFPCTTPPIQFSAPHFTFLNIESGDVVDVTIVREGENIELSHEIIEGLEITEVDFEENELHGTRDESKGDVFVEIYDTFGGDLNHSANAGVDGSAWTLDEGFTITSGMVVIVSQGDASGNMTTVFDQFSFETFLQQIVIDTIGNFGDITTNIAEVFADPTNKLYFESSSFGKITFEDFSYEDLVSSDPAIFAILENAEDLVKIVYDEEKNEMKVGVDTGALDFLDGFAATIEFFDVSEKLGVEGLTSENVREYLDIVVFDDGEEVVDLSDYFDWDEVVYDSETDVLTLPVNHFTEYVLGEATEEEVEVVEEETTEEVVAEEDEDEEELAETGMGVLATSLFGALSLLSYAVLRKRD